MAVICNSRVVLGWLLLSLGCVSAAAPESPLVVSDMNGKEHRPLACKDQKAVVLLFVLHDCPIANAYAPELKRICADYAARQIGFYIVHVDPDTDAATIRKHAAEYGHECPVLHDKQHQLVKRASVTRVPEAAVFTPDGKCVYRGRIDDRYLAFGKQRAQPTRRDLRDALDALLAGKPLPQATTPPVGCFIPPLATKGATP